MYFPYVSLVKHIYYDFTYSNSNINCIYNNGSKYGKTHMLILDTSADNSRVLPLLLTVASM